MCLPPALVRLLCGLAEHRWIRRILSNGPSDFKRRRSDQFDSVVWSMQPIGTVTDGRDCNGIRCNGWTTAKRVQRINWSEEDASTLFSDGSVPSRRVGLKILWWRRPRIPTKIAQSFSFFIDFSRINWMQGAISLWFNFFVDSICLPVENNLGLQFKERLKIQIGDFSEFRCKASFERSTLSWNGVIAKAFGTFPPKIFAAQLNRSIFECSTGSKESVLL